MDRVPIVNGLRGLAILAVIWHHYSNAPLRIDIPVVGRMLSVILSSGSTGVNLFFILSGFVLFLPYAQGKRKLRTVSDALIFYRRRFSRLMPLYYVSIFATLLLSILSILPALSTADTFRLLTMSFVFDRYNFAPPINYALWSIGVEVLFSALFPVLVLLLPRLGMRRLVAVAIASSLIVRVAGRLWNPALTGPNFLTDNIGGRLDEFVLGMMIAQLYALEKLPHLTMASFGTGVALILVAWMGFDETVRGNWPPVWTAPMNNLLDIGFCVLLVGLLHNKPISLANALSWPPLQLVGTMCYSLYIWHVPMLQATHATWPVGVSATLVPLMLTVIVATLTYRYVEFGYVSDWRRLIPAR